jgi:hypothetical protein
MPAKITTIADKDVGQVFGAVLEVNATDKLSVATVAGPGFLLRGHAPSSGPIPDGMLLPSTELDTFAVTSNAVLLKPQSFTMVDGVAATGLVLGSPPTFGSGPTTIDFTVAIPLVPVKAKLFFRDQATNVVDIIPVQKITPDSTGKCSLGASALLSGHTYDLLLLVEKYAAYAIFGKPIT